MAVKQFYADSWQHQAPGMMEGLHDRIERLNQLKRGMHALATTNQIYGQGADNMKAYISEVHISLIQALISAIETFQTASAVYWRDYSQVDSSGNFRLINEDFNAHIQDTGNAINHMNGFETHMRGVANSISYIVNVGDAGAGAIANVRDDLEAMQKIARDQQDTWSHYEQWDPGFNQVEEMIATIKRMLSEVGNITVGRSYQKGGFFNLPSYASLNHLSAQMGAYNQKNSGAITDWMNQLDAKTKNVSAGGSTNAYLELYREAEKLLKPMKNGKSDNVKRLEMLLKAYPANVVKRLLENDEFWLLANKLPNGAQAKLINGLTKFEWLGQAVSNGKWLPKIDTLGKAYANLNKLTSPVRTFVGESLKNSRFIQGAKQWGVAKGLGSVGQIATYAQLSITFASSGIDEYGKTGSIGKGVIGGAIETVKSIGPLEGMTLGATAASFIPIPVVSTAVGAAVGGGLGLLNVGVQFVWPNAYDNVKNWAYNKYDEGVKAVKDIGKGIGQGVDTVKHVFNDIGNTGKSIGKAISGIKLPEIKLGW